MKTKTTKKPRSKKDMIEYLKSHYRYNTMNSWNGSTSYANNIKIHGGQLNLTKAERDACYDMLDMPEAYDDFNEVIREFGRAHDFKWQIGSNGRSSGYLVLYQGESKPAQHKSRCAACGQLNFKPVAEVSQCGRCGLAGQMHAYEGTDVKCYPGRGTDEDECFEDWALDALKARVELVMEFDKYCYAACQAFVDFAMANKVVEKTVMVAKTVKVAEAR